MKVQDFLVINTNRGGQETSDHSGAELDRKVTSKISVSKLKVIKLLLCL